MQTSLQQAFGIDVYNSRSKATTAYQTQMIPYWRDFSQIMRGVYQTEGDLVNWNAISGAECPPIESTAMDAGGTSGWDTGLKETFVMTPIPGNSTFKIYLRVFYRISGYLYTTESPEAPRRVNASITFKIGTDLAQLDKADRTFQMTDPHVGYRPGTAYMTRRVYITAEKGFFGMTYADMFRDENSYHSSMYVSYVGDPLTNTPRQDILVVTNGAGNSSDTWLRAGGIYAGTKLFTESSNNPNLYNSANIILEGEHSRPAIQNSYIVNPDQISNPITNPSGTETILIGPYFSNGAKLWTNVFPGTPFLVMSKSAGGVGAETTINGWLYRATNIFADAGPNYFQQTRTWVRVGDAPTGG